LTFPHPTDARRRALLAGAAALPWAGCARIDAPPRHGGDWLGATHERGHRLRDPGSTHSPDVQRRATVIVVGAGIAGLAAARALMKTGIDDVQVFDLEDGAGGNSRAHSMGGMACPLGAHYLPLPGAQAIEVAELLAELGLSRSEAGKTVYAERHLCHSPQERLFIEGQWVEGLLPPLDALPVAERAATLAQYRRFGAAVQAAGRDRAFCVPTARANAAAQVAARVAPLTRVSFDAWLDEQSFTAPALRWYLDYCCRDDFGAGSGFVSAWAGLHYFASRHGFQAPGTEDADPRETGAVLTWAQGNAWLSERLAAPLGPRLHTGCVALRVREGRHDVGVELWNVVAQRLEAWTARQVVLALPLFVAARLLESAPSALGEAAALLQHAPWLVANLRLLEPLTDRGGAAPAWDNVLYRSATLGYVDAMHQSTRAHPGPTVLTAYWALGGNSPRQLREQRQRLLDAPWSAWAGAVLHELEAAHPEIGARVQTIDLMRYGHAMAIPAPGVPGHPALRALAQQRARVHFAHSDLSGYSVFEEAFFHGERAGRAIGQALRTGPRNRPVRT
jgi:predicted NAD/FAD-dependent oxidoreductase